MNTSIRTFVLAAAIAAPLGPLMAGDEETTLTVEQAQADCRQTVEIIKTTHPDLAFTADLDALDSKLTSLVETIDTPMTAAELWTACAPLNPMFGDAHAGLRFPEPAFKAFQSGGGRVFPMPVRVDRDAVLRSAGGMSAAGDAVKAGTQILSINGIGAETIFANMMPRMRGETESLRRFVMSRNFAAYFWTLYGASDAYEVELKSAGGEVRTVTLEDSAPPEKNQPEDVLERRILDDAIGYLRVGSFDITLKDAFAAFLEESFAAFSEAGAQALIIDVRENAGGAHDVSDQLVGYLTDKQVAPTSLIKARITEQNQAMIPTAAIGDVVEVPFAEPIPTDPDRTPFAGDVFVMVSQETYSQAIVFSVTMKDNALGTIVGEATGGNANQTGQVTITPLEHSGLPVLAPIYVLYRPSGDRGAGGLTPDIPLPHDPLNPDAALDALVAQITAG